MTLIQLKPLPRVLLLALGATLLILPSAAWGVTVTSTADGTGGGCTLRQAIAAVNAGDHNTSCGSLGSGRTTITLPAGTYALTQGQLSVAAYKVLEIVGANPNGPALTRIDAQGGSRVLEVAANADVRLAAIEVTGGRTAAAAPHPVSGFGGSSAEGGGILNRGTLALDHVIVRDNGTGNGGRGADGTSGDRAGKQGGVSGNGGGIFNAAGASLHVADSRITDNFTGTGGAGGDGIDGSGNQSSGAGGGAGNSSGSGGGLFNLGTAVVTTTTVDANATGQGGAGGGGGTGLDADITGGSAGTGGFGGDGGNNGTKHNVNSGFPLTVAIGGGGVASFGTITVTRSTISQNVTGAGGLGGGAGASGEASNGQYFGSQHGGAGGGGGLGAGLLLSGGTATITNVTIDSNRSGDGGGGGAGWNGSSPYYGGTGGDGGGLWWATNAPGGSVALRHATISSNVLGDAGDGGIDGGRGKGGGVATGGRYDLSSAVTVSSSIIAGNGNQALGDQNCYRSAGTAPPLDIVDGGYNITFPGTSCPGTQANPLLGLLQDNGGPTRTRVPGAGSPAIGLVPAGSCPVAEDQRGLPRPAPGFSTCDAGAVEARATQTGPTATTTTLASSANPSKAGAALTYTATVTPQPSGGTVTFTDGGTTIPGCDARPMGPDGQVTCVTTYGSSATHPIVATFSGHGDFAGSTSATLSQFVEPAPPGGGGGGGGGGGDDGPGGGGGGVDPGGPGAPAPIGGPGPGATLPGAGTPAFGTIRAAGTKVTFTLRCAGPTGAVCAYTITLSAREVRRGSRVVAVGSAKARKRRVKVTLGTASVTIPAGTSKAVTVALNARGRRLLKRFGRLPATLAATESGKQGAAPALRRAVRFRSRRGG